MQLNHWVSSRWSSPSVAVLLFLTVSSQPWFTNHCIETVCVIMHSFDGLSLDCILGAALLTSFNSRSPHTLNPLSSSHFSRDAFINAGCVSSLETVTCDVGDRF